MSVIFNEFDLYYRENNWTGEIHFNNERFLSEKWNNCKQIYLSKMMQIDFKKYETEI